MGRNVSFLLFLVLLRSFKTHKVSREDNPCVIYGQSSLGPCNQICVPANGSYVCQCLHGYKLSDDEHSCDINGNEEPGLFYVADNRMMVYFMEQGITHVVQGSIGTVSDLAVGPDRSLFWTDMHTRSVSMLQFDDAFKVNSVESVVDSGLVSPNGIAVDPRTSTLYVVDSKPGEIIVCTLKGEHCAVLLKNLTNPQDIVVESSKRQIFWSDWGGGETEGSIHCAGTDGTDSWVLVSGLQSPRNLVLDAASGTLFWVAQTLDDYVIQMLKLDQTDVVDIITFQSYHDNPRLFMSMGQIFIQEHDEIRAMVHVNTNWQIEPLVRDVKMDGPVTLFYQDQPISKGNGLTCHINFGQIKPLVRDVKMDGPVTLFYQDQPIIKDYVCETSPCSHLCVPSNSNGGYRCLCPIDMELTLEVTCKKKSQNLRFLVSGTKKDGIYEVPLDYIGLDVHRAEKLVGGDIGCLTYGSTNQIIVFYEDHQNTIEVIDLQSTIKRRTVLYEGLSRIEGITLDEEGGYMYWTDGHGSIIRAQMDGAQKENIHDGLDKPRGIVFDKINRMLYVSDWGRSPRILQCNTTGSIVCSDFLSVPGGHPNHLIISTILWHGRHRPVLLWTDSKLDMIGIQSLDGNDDQKTINLDHIRNIHPFALAASGDTVYCTDLNNELIHYIDINTNTQRHSINLGLGSLFNLATFSYRDENLPPPSDSEKSSMGTSPSYREPVHIPSALPESSNFLWVVFLVLGLLFLALIFVTAAYFYYRQKQKQNWMQGIIKYLKKHPHEDSECLMNQSVTTGSRPSFLNFDDLDYPECDRMRSNHDNRTTIASREFSTISMDSAFTELQDFANTSGETSP